MGPSAPRPLGCTQPCRNELDACELAPPPPPAVAVLRPRCAPARAGSNHEVTIAELKPAEKVLKAKKKAARAAALAARRGGTQQQQQQQQAEEVLEI